MINGQSLAALLCSAAANLDNQKDEINNLNVFPVPDGDTGINMALTLAPLLRPYEGGTLSEVMKAAAGDTLRSARGNSGAILSLFLRGMAKVLEGREEADAALFAEAFTKGTEEAYRAIATPTEGTILTVMRLTAEAAGEAHSNFENRTEQFFRYLLDVARRALARTPEMLPILRQAHVVDAGGAGFVAMLEGMTLAAEGAPVEASGSHAAAHANFAEFDTADIRFSYCTECIVEKADPYLGDGKAEELRSALAAMGDSLVFIEDECIIKIHVHVNDPGQVLSLALAYGILATVKVENMKKQHTELTALAAAPDREFGFVSVSVGDGIAEVFREMGCDRIVRGGQSMNPSTEDLLSAIEATPARTVFVLPNNKNIFMVAKEAAALAEDRQVVVLPSRSVPEGLTALLNFDPERSVEDNAAVMEEAMTLVKSFSITHAARDSEIDGVEIKKGMYLGLLGGKILAARDTLKECLAALTPEMQSAAFLTVFAGEDATEADSQTVSAILSRDVPDAEVAVSSGGQPLYDFIISAE